MDPAADVFLQRLENSRLLSPEQLARVSAEAPRDEPKALAIWLLKNGLLTRWQAQRLLAGQDRFFFGKYRLLEQLGQGGMGTVYKAQEEHGLKRLVALKIISQKALQRPNAEKRFLREVQVAAALNHPHIVAAYEADKSHGQYYFVMEYVPGKDLGAWIREFGMLPLDWSCECIRQTALGLQHAHEKKLVHRDIKPANLLVVAGSPGEPPTVKILDLGLARFVDPTSDNTDLTGTGEVMGTVDYMSPEQARNTKTADIRADVFSLGCTLFKMLTGDVPFPGANVTEKLMARAMQDARRVRELRPEVPAKLDALLAKMLARKPEDRFQTPGEVAEALLPFCRGEHEDSTQLRLKEVTQASLSPAREDGSEAQAFLAQLSHDAGDETEELTAREKLKLAEGRSESLSPQSAARIRSQVPRSRTGLWVVLASLAVLLLLGAGAFLLDSQPSQRLVAIRVNQPDALVAIGFSRSHRSPKTREPLLIGLPLGKHTLVVSKDGFREERRQFELTPPADGQAAEPLRIEVALVPLNSVPSLVTPTPDSRLIDPGPGSVPQSRSSMNAPPTNVAAGTMFTNSLGMKFAYCPPGEFTMGSPETELLRSPDETLRQVTLTQGFYLGIYEVTQSEYTQVMGKNPSGFAPNGAFASKVSGLDTSRFPVEQVNWEDANLFCDALSKKDGRAYRLPTEAEWEYACRAGTSTPYSFGEACNGREANVKGTEPYGTTVEGWFLSRTTTVGSYPPNAWGLFDMHGNFSEWCADLYREDLPATAQDPRVDQSSSSTRVHRGAEYSQAPYAARSARRRHLNRANTSRGLGFRVVLVASTPAAPVPLPEETIKAGTTISNSLGMKFAYCPPGTFTMGSPETEAGRQTNEIPHRVILTQGFYLGVYEVTQAEFLHVTGANPSTLKYESGQDPLRSPVESVTLEAARDFCRKLSARDGLTYRLPTEAEWEYACRAGKSGPFNFGSTCNGMEANCNGMDPYGTSIKGFARSRPALAGDYPPNAWGLYDMHGNVWEWCADSWSEYPTESVTDPRVDVPSPHHVMRGGFWGAAPSLCRSAARGRTEATYRNFILGFRVVLDPSRGSDNLVVTPMNPPAKVAPGTVFANSLGMKFAYCPPGTFLMGSPETEAGRQANEAQSTVTISQGFYLGRHEVTQAEFEQVMDRNPSAFSRTGTSNAVVKELDPSRFPVDSVTWSQAVEFCQRLSQREGKSYRLPTEAEWEYACRAGTSTPFHFGNSCDGTQINCKGNDPYGNVPPGPFLNRPDTVGSHSPNAWGLYDMHGNVFEWCDGYLDDFPSPLGMQSPTTKLPHIRINRGGSYRSDGGTCRAAYRSGVANPQTPNSAFGFRVLLEASTDTSPQKVEEINSETVPAKAPLTPAITNSLGMKLVPLPPGKFFHGTQEITLTQGFAIGAYEVTQKEFQRVMGTIPSAFSSQGEHQAKLVGIDTSKWPVENVTWESATQFCEKLSAKEHRTYRLPTEMEWEYACRASTTTAFSCGNKLTEKEANFDGRLGRPDRVGSYPPNAFGLFDLHGNVREWTADWFADLPAGPLTDPKGPAAVSAQSSPSQRVFRGGSWAGSTSNGCQSSYRRGAAPTFRAPDLGFRVVLVRASTP